MDRLGRLAPIAALVFAAVAIITAMAIALFLLVVLIERLTIPWARSRGGSMK